MCGICGTLGFGSPELIRRMARRIEHRGPDGEGFLIDLERQAYLASTRLAVLDPDRGEQPLWNDSHEIAVVYNGEIYNEPQLRAELEQVGHRYRTATDTETIPRLFQEVGPSSFARFNGMFAFALWDAREGAVWLVRDPLGIKPLFLWHGPEGLAFASEVKCFLEIPAFRAALDQEALHLLLNVRFIPGPKTLFRGVEKLPPAHWLKWQAGSEARGRYWSLPQVEPGIAEEEAIEGFYERFEAAVTRQMRADVPVGLYLSGGIDSSLLVAALARRGIRPSTFCLGFNEPTDELEDARLVADHFGTDHHEELLEIGSLRDYPVAVYHLEEPKVNGLQGFRLARAVKRHVTVALSGLGGDELLCGYAIYQYLRRILWLTARSEDLPGARFPGNSLGKVLDFLGFWGGFRADNLKRIAEWTCSFADLTRLYVLLRNGWDFTERVGHWLYRPDAWSELHNRTRREFDPYLIGEGDPLDRVQRAEFQLKMVDDFLVNGDRMSMASSIEERVPYLDLELVEFMARVPGRIKFKNGVLKWIVKQPREGWLPPFVLRKKKWGFSFDSVEQARKDLLILARFHLTPDAIERLGLFRWEAVKALLDARPHPALRWHFFLLWLILGVHFWRQIFVEGESPDTLSSQSESAIRTWQRNS